MLVHVDHRLRASSGDEAKRAASLADALDLDFEAVAVATPPTDVHPGVGVEEAARRERYRLLFAAAATVWRARGGDGASSRDQAETVLLHLLRGGGVHGAAGMAERSPSPVPVAGPARDISHESTRTSEPWLWRPLLSEPREAIEAYVAKLGLAPIEDPSNEDHDAAAQRVAPRGAAAAGGAFPGSGRPRWRDTRPWPPRMTARSRQIALERFWRRESTRVDGSRRLRCVRSRRRFSGA